MAADLSGCLVNNRYSVDKKIQSGYYGTTWLAIDKLKSMEVCLKVGESQWKARVRGRLGVRGKD